MFQKLMSGALIAGIGAGLLAALLHFVFIQELILTGEAYESGEIVHFGGVAPAAGGHDHAAHDHGTEGHGDDHGDSSALTRNALTVGFTVVLYAAYAMLLTAAFAVAAQMGRQIDAREGMIWGLAGFAAFQLMPAMGLAPELPGTIAEATEIRQVWWWATVLATALGAGLMAFGRSVLLAVVGFGLALVPHLYGAPVLDRYTAVAPADLGALFSARVLGVGLLAWLAMGWLAGWRWSRSN